MSPWAYILTAILAWIAGVVLIRLALVPLRRNAPGGDPINALLKLGAKLYSKLMHRAIWRGEDDLRRNVNSGPLIVVSNHTSSVDPVLIQAGCWFPIRWLMAAEMMTASLDWLWKQQDVIPVERDRADSKPVRTAIRHLRAGGVIGIFPEGRIIQPRGRVGRFLDGVGLLASKTGVPVLLVWVSGTPDTEALSEAFFTPSRARIEYVGVFRFKQHHDPAAITRALREKLAEASGWTLAENGDEAASEPAAVH